jgi:hypothetical protein
MRFGSDQRTEADQYAAWCKRYQPPPAKKSEESQEEDASATEKEKDAPIN